MSKAIFGSHQSRKARVCRVFEGAWGQCAALLSGHHAKLLLLYIQVFWTPQLRSARLSVGHSPYNLRVFIFLKNLLLLVFLSLLGHFYRNTLLVLALFFGTFRTFLSTKVKRKRAHWMIYAKPWLISFLLCTSFAALTFVSAVTFSFKQISMPRFSLAFGRITN